MFVSILIAFFALAAAVTIMAVAIRRTQETPSVNSWQDVKEAFAEHPMRGVRDEAQMISDPVDYDTDLRLDDLLAEGQDGTGYVEPRDILSLRSGRN